jgi:hypothetical protein
MPGRPGAGPGEPALPSFRAGGSAIVVRSPRTSPVIAYRHSPLLSPAFPSPLTQPEPEGHVNAQGML